jgi:LacI family transcriptional regulator
MAEPSLHPPGLPPRKVAVLVDTSTTWGRDVISGVHRYASGQGNWQLFVEPRGMEQRRWLPHTWKGNGVIARIGLASLAKQLRSLHIPVVNVSGIRLPHVNYPRVISDQAAAAELAANHLLDRGFERFAYFSLFGLDYVRDHQSAFENALRLVGHECAVFTSQPEIGSEPNWSLDLKKLGKWLRSLPKPLAVFTWNSSCAREVIYACALADLAVPDEVAVLSGTEDDLLCKVAPVPISAVRQNAEAIGYRAAAELDIRMRGAARDKPAAVWHIPPTGIIVRRSTDALAIQDAALVKAIRLIREGFMRPIQVEDVARHAGLSRRVLEQRFRAVLSRSPAEEIRRVRIQHACDLLRQTTLPVSLVAEKSGFSSAEYMAVIFRRHLGQTPLQVRA